MTDLEGVGYGVSLGFGINATGEAVGRPYLAQTVPTTGCPPRHTCVAHPADPFSWIAGSMTDLGTLGGTFGEARAVNRNGDIVGGSNSDAFLAQAQQDARPRDYLCGRSRRCGAGRAAWLRARRVVRERAGRSLGLTADPASMATPARSARPWRGSLDSLRDLSTTRSRKWLLA